MAKRCTPWEEVRARYETEDCTYRQLAEEYGVSIQSIWTHAQKECWKGRRTRGRDQSIDDRRYLRQVAKALMTAARQAAAQVEDGEVSIKELKEMAGVLQTLTGLEKTLREEEPAAAETVQVVLGDAEEWSRLGARADRVVRPYERDVAPQGHLFRCAPLQGGVPCGMGFRACGRGERIPTPVTSVTGSE